MDSIKMHLITIVKETLKFTLFAIALFIPLSLFITIILLYLKIDIEISAVIAGVIAGVAVFILDYKVIRSIHKINDAESKIFRKIFRIKIEK